MNILVFTSKRVGLDCVKYLLDKFGDDQYLFVLSQNDSDDIKRVLEEKKQKYEYFNQSFIKNLNSKPKGTFDWLLNLWGPFILKSETLNLAKKRLNIHPSLAPYARGNDTAAWIIRKQLPAGVSLLEMDSTIDTGRVWVQKEYKYSFPVTGIELYQKLSELCSEVFTKNWKKIRNGSITPMPQKKLKNESLHKRADTNADRILDLDHDEKALEVVLKFLAHDFSPKYNVEIIKDGRRFKARLQLNEVK